MVMLKKLLTDRFNLGIHREQKEFSICAKIKSSTAPFDEASNVTSTLYPARSGGVDHALLPAHNVTMQQFASVLQRAILDRPVVDKTGCPDVTISPSSGPRTTASSVDISRPALRIPTSLGFSLLFSSNSDSK